MSKFYRGFFENHRIFSTFRFLPRPFAYLIIKNIYCSLLILLKNPTHIKTNQIMGELSYPKKTRDNAYKETIMSKFDFSLLLHGKKKDYEDFSKSIHISGVSNLEAALQEDTGIFILSSHFSLFYLIVLAFSNPDVKNLTKKYNVNSLSVIRPEDTADMTTLWDKIAAFTHKKINTILFSAAGDNKSATMRLLKLLKRKEIVCGMGDVFRDGSNAIMLDFLGTKAFFPINVGYSVAATNSVLLPIFITRSDKVFNIHIKPFIKATKGEPLEDQATEIMQKFVNDISSLIEESPQTWTGWELLFIQEKLFRRPE